MTDRHGASVFGREAAAERSAAETAAARSGAAASEAPDPEVDARPKRRTFTAEYKRRFLEQAEAAKARGELGALLRREGIYSSTLTGWRRERDAAAQAAFSRPRGPKPKRSPETAEIEKLRRRNQRRSPAPEQARSAEVFLHVVNGKNGRPIAGARLLVMGYKCRSRIQRFAQLHRRWVPVYAQRCPPVLLARDLKTGPDGIGAVAVPQPGIRYLQVWVDRRTLCQRHPNYVSYPVRAIVLKGARASNECGKVVVAPRPGDFYVFARSPTFRERLAW